MGIQNTIRKLDIFGKPVQLRLEKKKTHKTLCGGIMTLLIILSVSLISIYYTEKLITKQDPGVDVISTINRSQSVDIESFKLGFAINILNVNYNSFQEDSTDYSINELIQGRSSTTLINKGINVKAYYTSRKEKAEQQGFNEKQIEIPLIPCSQSDYFFKYWESIFDLPEQRLDEFLCPQLSVFQSDEIEIAGDLTSRSAKQLQIKVNVDKKIMEQDNWQDIINNSLVIVKVFDQLSYLESYQNPIKFMSRTITEWIDLNQKRFIELRYSQEVVSTDEGIYFKQQVDENLLKLSEIHHFQQQINKGNYQVINILTSVTQTKTIYLRSYIKATIILAYIGGFLQLTLLFGKFITKPFAKLSFYTSLVNEVFQFEDDKEKIEQKINETEQRPFQLQTTVVDDITNKTLNISTFSPQRSQFFLNQKKCSLDIINDLNQTHQESSMTANNMNNRKSNITRGSQLNSKNCEDEQIKKFQMSESKKNSVNLLSPFATELNTPIPIKKKSLYKNQMLLSNFREYFEADRLEKRLIVSLKSILFEFFRKMWFLITYVCQKNKQKELKSTILQKLNYSKNKVTERLDIIYIVQKLQEIDKLKQIILNKNQRKLFEYLPRPVLKNDIIFQDKQSNQKAKSQSKSSEWSILKEDESIQQKAIKAWIAFTNITNKEILDKNDKKVIKLLDFKAKNIFEITSKKISDQLQEQLYQNSTKIRLQSCNMPSNIITDSLNNSKNNNQIQQRKSKNFYQFSIQASNKRNSTTKIKNQKVSLKEQTYQELGTLNFLDQSISKPSEIILNDDPRYYQNSIAQKVPESPSQQSSHSSQDSSFSSSNSSSNSDSSEISENSYQQQELSQQKSNKTILKLSKLKEFSDNQKLNNLKIALNEIPENIEKSLRHSQDYTANKSSIQQNTPLNFSSIPIKKCPALKIDMNQSITPKQQLKQKYQQNRSQSETRGSKTEKAKEKFINQFIKYFDEVKNQDQLEIQEIKLNFNKFHSNINLRECPQNLSNNINNQLIEQLPPKTPHCNIPPDIQDTQINKKADKEDINKQQFAENKFLSRRINQMMKNKKISTPQTSQNRKNDNSKNEIYKSASFTQFLKKITPIIVQNKLDTSIKPNNNNNNNNNSNNQF